LRKLKWRREALQETLRKVTNQLTRLLMPSTSLMVSS
jgi:hypothetical protein